MCPDDDIVAYRLDRTPYAHTALLLVAESALESLNKHNDEDAPMVATVFAAFAMEAFLNFVGEELFRFWDEIDMISSEKKLRVICEHLQYMPDLGARPYQSLHELWKARNLLAHARPETLSQIYSGPMPNPLQYPKATW